MVWLYRNSSNFKANCLPHTGKHHTKPCEHNYMYDLSISLTIFSQIYKCLSVVLFLQKIIVGTNQKLLGIHPALGMVMYLLP